LHARDPLWVPPLRRDVRALLDRRRNPFFEHGEAEYFLVLRNGQVVGRVAAIANRLHNEIHRDRVAFFGFFETEQDGGRDVADLLMRTVTEWARSRGFDTLRGPASFSTNDECGLLIEGFDTPNTILMPHNPPWYPPLLEGAGFRRAKDLLVYQGGSMTKVPEVPERLQRATDLVRTRLRLTVRILDLGRFHQEIEMIKELYNRCWERNWGFVPMTDREIDHLAVQFKPVVVPELVPIVEHDGVPIGFGLALPDLNQVLRANRSGRLFPAAFHLLWALKTRRFRRLRILLLGVAPEFRGKGVDALLYHCIWTAGIARGITWGEAGWILEDNTPMNLALQKIGFRHYKTYRMYNLPL
jgi:GNAT superfamily N-acetyltransferase